MFHHHHHHFGGRGGRRFFGEGGRGGFFGRGGPWHGGPGMRAAKMLVAGDLQLIILLLLKERARHGYEIIKAIEEHSSGIYTPSPGMVYPALTYLEEMGHAAATTEGAKKLYTLTPEGAQHLEKHHAAASEVWDQLALFGRKLARFQKQFADDEEVVDRFGTGSSGADDDWQRVKAEFRALREELKAAIREKLNASMQEKQRVLSILRRAVAEIRGK
jgi:DNA-binding PadR family transcriptional regulator